MKICKINFLKDMIVNRNIIKFIDDYLLMEDAQAVQILLFLFSMYEKDRDVDLDLLADAYKMDVQNLIKIVNHWKEKGILDLNFKMNSSEDLLEKDIYSESFEATPVDDQKMEEKECLENMDSLGQDEDFMQFAYLYQAYGMEIATADYLKLQESYLYCRKNLDLAIYLLDSCVQMIETLNTTYLLTVAKDWNRRGIQDKEEAQIYLSRRKSDVNAIMKAFGITDRFLGQAELLYVEAWSEYPLELVIEACSRTLLNISKVNFKYADQMLKAWKEAGIKNKEEIPNRESIYSKRKSKNNSFHNFSQREYDYDELERLLTNR